MVTSVSDFVDEAGDFDLLAFSASWQFLKRLVPKPRTMYPSVSQLASC